ncbi:alpha/beta hydrolase [Streptomyces sp. SID13666]|uniref:alpha/beta fold hydrolase n=1 Tax=unclassified Streptomyces TaxID=2593676 RepID=UPI0013BFD6EE|nr:MULTISPECIES: alpha/beta hydrolase [unclassified Streptomyces]NEA57425.1 alpha/beta hydrolase [Streptomyces sp. SID13666]NEA75231.1 alpha/beta hydrolase [Streptomyces sp. SID13588]
MPFVSVGEENSARIRLYYEDHGSGRPVVLVHGWPLNAASWEKQAAALLDAGHRVITYDRRGFGRSDQPDTGYDYDTLAADLHQLIGQLDLSDVSLVGFSMGSGEVTRYLGTYGSDRIRKAVMIGVVPPFLLKTEDNPSGVDGAVFEGIQQAIVADRPAFLAGFLHDFYNVDVLGGERVSDQVVQYSWNVAAAASARATLACVAAWLTDFREDLPKIDVPTLIIHGDADRTLPLDATAIPLSQRIDGAKLVVIPDAPHGLIWTHAAEVNAELLDFLA